MKKVTVFILIFILIFTSLETVSAQDETHASNVETNYDYGYSYTKYTNAIGQTICSYTKGSSSTNLRSIQRETTENHSDTTYIKSLLFDLGMETKFIEALPTNSLDMYTNADSIMITTTYSKVTADGVVSIIDEDTALDESSQQNSSRVITLPEDFGNEEGETPTYYHDTQTSTYMKITLAVSVLGNGRFHYSVDAVWLTPPTIRVVDSLGICVKNNYMVENTQSGWFNYSHTVGLESATPEPNLIQNNYPSSFINCVTQSGWLGVGFTDFLPPEDNDRIIFGCLYLDRYHDFYAHLEFIGEVNNKDTESYFYATATYEHISENITLYTKPNLEITIAGNSSYINMNTSLSTDIITVPISLPIHHVP